MFRIRARTLVTLIAAIGVAACSDSPGAGPKPSVGRGLARLTVAPVFSPAARAAAARLADFGITFDHVRVLIVRPVAETVIDTTIAFVPGQTSVTLDLTVNVLVDGEAFKASIDYTSGGTVVFHGEATVQSHPPDQQAPPAQITVEYTGPGANVTRIAVSPKSPTVTAPSVAFFTAAAFDANNAPVANVPFSWTTSDPTIATISNAGTLTPTGKRGSVTVTATTPNNITDNAVATITLPPAGIALVSGGGQTGKVGAALGQPAVVRVTAADGIGVSGVSVNFAAPTGGKVGSATVSTDANGNASTSLTLGTVVGPQAFAAAALGFSVAIPETATAGDAAAIAVVSGSGQSDSVTHTLKLPLVVKVADQFGNALPNVTVNWTRTAGSGTLSSATSVSGTDGVASVSYTLGATTGTETITASASGLTGTATFTEQAVAGAPTAIVVVSGDGQSGRILTALAPFVVHVTDANGNGVNGTTVTWTATNGTITATTTTDATGASSNTMTLGTATGAASATATAGGKSVSFTATAQPGVVAKIAFQTGPPASNASGVPLTPAIRVALQDAGGNQTAGGNAVTIALGANPSSGTLTGTLTRNAVNGIATFDDLKIDKAGAGYTLVASSVGTPSVTSSAFAIVAGSGATLTIVAGEAQTAVVNTAVAVAPSVRLADAAGNVIANAPVTFTPTTGSGSAVPATVNTDAGGVATLTSWTLGPIAGPQSLVAQSGTANITIHATARPGAPARLAMLIQPSANAQSGIVFATQPVIQLQDASGNSSPQSGVTVTAAVATGGGTLSGSLTAVTDTGGRAAFVNLKLNGLVGPRTLGFTSTGLTGATSSTVTLAAGTPAKLQYSVNPSSTTASAPITPAVAVSVLDADNNQVTTATNPVTVAITAGSGTSGAVLSGPTTVAANGGVATFNGLSIATAGTAYTLTATSGATGGLTPAVSTPFNITAGTAAKLVLVAGDAQTAAVNTAVPVAPSVRLLDATGNSIAGAAVNFAPATGSGTAQPTTVATDATGTATLTSWTLGTVAGAQSLVASSAGVQSVTFNATAQAGPAALLVMLTQPSANVQSGVVFPTQPVIQLEDASGNAKAQSGVTVTAAVATGGGTLSGTLTAVTDAAGRATFTNLKLNGLIGGRTLGFSSSGLTSATSATVTVAAGAAAKLQYSVNPTSTTAGATITPAVSVTVLDADNNTVTTATNSVTLVITAGSGTSGAVLSGPTTVAASGGVATFNGLSISTAGTAYTLTATSTGLTSGISTPFNITSGPPASLVIVAGNGQTAPVGTAVPVAPSVQLRDAAGNSIAGVAVTFTPGTGSGTAQPTNVTTDATGTATLTSWTLGTGAGPQSLVASSPGVAGVTFNATAQPGPATKFVLLTQPSAAAQSGIPFAVQPVLQLQDANSNAKPQAGVTVTAAIATGAGTLGGTPTAVTDAAGQATFTNLKINGVVGNRTLGFTSPGLTGATSATVTLSAGTAAKLAFSVNPTSTPAGADITPAVVVNVLDADSNLVTTAANAVSVAITPGTGASGATLSGTVTVNAVNGVATFPGLFIDLAALVPYSLTASSPALTSVASTAFNITTPPETLNSVAPSTIDAVFATVPGVLTGTVSSASAVTVTGGNVAATNLAHVNANTLTVDFNIVGGAPTSTPRVSFTTPAGVSNVQFLNLFSVGTAPVQLGAANGGSGGNAYSIDCPAGTIGTGIDASGGTNVDRVQVLCQPVTGTNRAFGATVGSGSAGGGGGSQANLTCPASYVLVGLTGFVGNGGAGVNDLIQGICAPIAGGALVTTGSVGSQNAGAVSYSSTCPAGLAVAGIQGGAGNLVDRTQIKCR